MTKEQQEKEVMVSSLESLQDGLEHVTRRLKIPDCAQPDSECADAIRVGKQPDKPCDGCKLFNALAQEKG